MVRRKEILSGPSVETSSRPSYMVYPRRLLWKWNLAEASEQGFRLFYQGDPVHMRVLVSWHHRLGDVKSGHLFISRVMEVRNPRLGGLTDKTKHNKLKGI